MSASKRPSPSLSLLLAASAALVGNRSARADEAAPPLQSVGYRFHVYDEDAFPDRPVIGSPQRYHVDSQQLALSARAGERETLTLNAVHEVMSGSSPWYLVPGPDRRPIQVLSGATIRDHRNAIDVALTHDAGGNDTTTLDVSYSQERDYHAAAIGAQRSVPLSSALTLGFGGSLSHDRLRPTDAILYGRIERAEKNTWSTFGSLSLVLSKYAVVESGLQLTLQSGYLSDPYKLVTVADQQIADTRPDRRGEAAWLVRYRLAATARASLHADARLAANSWGQHSVTLELGWYQELADGWRLIPGVRYYAQDRARFYAPFFDHADGRYFSSDYRLGAFGALSASLDLRKRFGHWELSAGAERYHAATRYALGGADLADPATVSYSRLFAGLDYHFD
jgi:hypothetical protein